MFLVPFKPLVADFERVQETLLYLHRTSRRTMYYRRLMLLLMTALTVKRAFAVAVNDTASPTQSSNVSFSYVSGPFINGPSVTWDKAYRPVTVGTVIITVNTISAQIGSTTMYRDKYTNSSNMSLYEPIATNRAGTRTYVNAFNNRTRMTYPTNNYGPRPELTWAAVVPITTPGFYSQMPPQEREDQFPETVYIPEVGKDGACCFTSFIVQPLPTSIQFTQDQIPIDPEDPRGWLYTVRVGSWWAKEKNYRLQPNQVSSLLPHRSLDIAYTPCMHTACATETVKTRSLWLNPPSFARSVVTILATSTAVIDA